MVDPSPQKPARLDAERFREAVHQIKEFHDIPPEAAFDLASFRDSSEQLCLALNRSLATSISVEQIGHMLERMEIVLGNKITLAAATISSPDRDFTVPFTLILTPDQVLTDFEGKEPRSFRILKPRYFELLYNIIRNGQEKGLDPFEGETFTRLLLSLLDQKGDEIKFDLPDSAKAISFNQVVSGEGIPHGPAINRDDFDEMRSQEISLARDSINELRAAPFSGPLSTEISALYDWEGRYQRALSASNLEDREVKLAILGDYCQKWRSKLQRGAVASDTDSVIKHVRGYVDRAINSYRQTLSESDYLENPPEGAKAHLAKLDYLKRNLNDPDLEQVLRQYLG